MKKIFTILLATVAVTAWAAVSPFYINNSPITTFNRPPQVDARAFINRSQFDVFTALPYQAQHVQYWTNHSVMTGTPGYRFEQDTTGRLVTKKGKTKLVRSSQKLQLPSAVFYNDGSIFGSTLLAITATNIFNSGRLDSLEAGKISLSATNGTAELARAGIRVGPATGFAAPCSFFTVGNTFFPDAGIVDQYWGAGQNNFLGTNGMPLDLTTLSNLFSLRVNTNAFFNPPTTPSHQVLQTFAGLSRPFTFMNLVSLPSPFQSCSDGYTAFLHTSANNATSLVVNVVFVPTNSFLAPSNLSIAVRFTRITGRAGNAYAPVVEFRSGAFDIVDQQLSTNYLTLIDASAAQTNITLARPLVLAGSAGANTRRPSTYTWIRGRFCNFDSPFIAETNNAVYSPFIFHDARFSTNRVNTIYAADSVAVGTANSQAVINQPLGVNPSLSDPTNFAGSVTINAANLNLAGTRIKATDFIGLRTGNLISNTLAQLDAPFIDFNVRTTNSSLVLSNITPATVQRLVGTISAWSSVWSVDYTNFILGPLTNGTNVIIGQLNNIRYHVLFIENCLRSEQPVTMNRFAASAPSLVLADNISINSGLQLDANAVTVAGTGRLNLPAGSNLGFTNVRHLLNFTNQGFINVPASAFFGDFQSGHISSNGVPPLDNFVNHGSIFASSIFVRATNAEHSGGGLGLATLTANGGVVVVRGGKVAVTNAQVRATSDIEFHGGDLNLQNTFLSAGRMDDGLGHYLRGALVIDAANSLGDAPGVMSVNDWFVTSGVRLPTRPVQSGNLLGTRIYSSAGQQIASTMMWPARNLGAVPSGFSNNLALGRLVLDGVGGNLFRFQGATPGSALYIDYLELLNDATNYNFALGVDANFTIYFADSNISPEKLDSLGGGRLRWVSTFAGPQSSTSILYPNGVTYTFNAGLARSNDTDSDGDGVLNVDDCTPFAVPDFDSTRPCAAKSSTSAAPLRGAMKSAPVVSGATASGATASGPASGGGLVVSGSAAGGPDLALRVALAPESGAVILNWNAPAHSANAVEFTESLGGGAWQSLTNFINGPVDARVTVRDAATAPQRVYRVRVDASKE